METRPYATAAGIRKYLDSLEGLHRLVEDRSAANGRFELLPEFCVLGRYILLVDGGIGSLRDVITGPECGLQMTLSGEEFGRAARKRFGKDWQMAYRTPARLAPYDSACPECGNAWSIEDCHDAIRVHQARYRREEYDVEIEVSSLDATYHAVCHRAYVERGALGWAKIFLSRIGLSGTELEMVEGRIKDDPTPWFRLKSGVGPISFGRLGAGFCIDWKDTARPLSGLFRGAHRLGHPIKHGEYDVYPPDEKFMIEHFFRLREALGF